MAKKIETQVETELENVQGLEKNDPQLMVDVKAAVDAVFDANPSTKPGGGGVTVLRIRGASKNC